MQALIAPLTDASVNDDILPDLTVHPTPFRLSALS
jgi:hypothetical protein